MQGFLSLSVFLWLFTQWRIWFPFVPPTQCFQIAEGQGSLLSCRQTGLGVQELYIAPPWRCAHTSTHTNVHAGFGMNKWETVAALHPPSFASPQFFSNFQSRVSSVQESDAASNFSAVLLPTASNNLTPARTGTGPTTSQMRSTTNPTSQPGEPIRAITWLWESSRINPHFRN